MVILATKTGREIRMLEFKKYDVDLTNEKDFELTIPTDMYQDDLAKGARIIVPGTEYGGQIGRLRVKTDEDMVVVGGFNWRGKLYHKIIQPPSGQAYKTVSGELNTILRGLIAEAGLDKLFYVPNIDTQVTLTNYQFDRYTTLYDGIEKMLNQVQNTYTDAYRMDLKYIQGENGDAGYVQLQALPVVDYSETVELSQDSQLDFIIEQIRNGVNHLILLGKGELAERTVRHLYVDVNGVISTTQTQFGEDEVCEIYDYPSAEDETTLITDGMKRLQERMDNERFEMNAAIMEEDIAVGDKIGGRDYITEIVCSDYITNKIYTIENGVEKIEYTIGGEKKDEAIIE